LRKGRRQCLWSAPLAALLCTSVVAVPSSVVASPRTVTALSWSAPRFDDLHAPPVTGPARGIAKVRLTAFTCANSGFCGAVDRDGALWQRASATESSHWLPSDVDGATPIVAVSCPSRLRCAAVDQRGDVVQTLAGAGGGIVTGQSVADPSGTPTGISCASLSLCVVVDAVGDTFTSTDPFSGAAARWVERQVDGAAAMTAISCWSVHLCAAVDLSGQVLTSSDPGAISAAWTTTAIDPSHALLSISCGAPNLCVAGDDGGSLFASMSPLSGSAPHWRLDRTASPAPIVSVSCVGIGFCSAVQGPHDVLSTTTPGAAGRRWKRTTLAESSPLLAVSCWSGMRCDAIGQGGDEWGRTPQGQYGRDARLGDPTVTSVSCPSVTFCVAVDPSQGIAESTSPRTTVWRRSVVTTNGSFSDVDCLSRTECVAVDGQGDLWRSRNPTLGQSGWEPLEVDAAFPLRSVSCDPAGTFCGAVDPVGVLTSTRPQDVQSEDWPEVLLDGRIHGELTSISCPSAQLCVAVDSAGEVVTSRDPGQGASATWTVSSPLPVHGLHAVECPAATLCLAADDAGDVAVSQDPSAGATAWSVEPVADEPLSAISCPSTSLCVAVAATGPSFLTSDPAGGPAAWTTVTVPGASALSALSCVATQCVAGGGGGRLWVGTLHVGSANASSARPHVLHTPDAAVRPHTGPPMQLGLDTILQYRCTSVASWDQMATNQVDAFKALGANAIGIMIPLYMGSATSDEIYAKSTCGTAFQSPSPSLVSQVVSIAHAAGLTVLLRPALDQSNLSAVDPYVWRGNIAPADPRAWFASYLATLSPYLQMAQADHVEHFAISSELESMANSPYWLGTIASARRIYTGDLVFCASWVNNGDEVPWPGTSAAVDMYRGLPAATTQASPAELAAGWDRVLSTYDPLPSINSVTNDEVGIPAQDGAYAAPNAILPTSEYPFDPQIQANWFTAACSFAAAEHMQGIYFWGAQMDFDDGLLPTASTPNEASNLQPLTQQAIARCFAGAQG
jgi:hypothetical protein